MLFSLNELKKLVDIKDISTTQLIDRLTFAGFEVEDHYKKASASKIAVGKIVECIPHPDSDHLHLLKVDLGDKGIADIVCGAKNARVGIKVIVALPGCRLDAIDTTIKPGKIRGYTSNGMCCSLLELGLTKEELDSNSPSSDGIEELDDSFIEGQEDILERLSLDDEILDINVLPNRPDCLSYIGMAREISSLTGSTLTLSSVMDEDLPYLKDDLNVKSLTDRCPRIDIVKIKGVVEKKETPKEIRMLLQANGIRSISPIVDLGNYVMLLSGQPINMYDEDCIKDDTLIVRDDLEGKFTTFDDKEVQLQRGDLVILDSEKPLCLAGIVAGKSGSISSSSKDILVELACFYHANIRRTSNRIGISTPSSLLFAKERNPLLIDEAIKILLKSLDLFFDDYKVVSHSLYNSVIDNDRSFHFTREDLNSRLGSSYSQKEIDDVLKAYRIEKIGEDRVLPPIDRVDLVEQCDIDEEVFRYYTADKVNPSLKSYPLTLGGLSQDQKLKRRIREELVDSGFDEILSFTLISLKQDEEISLQIPSTGYKLINPMTKDHEYVRRDLMSSMIATLDYNRKHQNKDLALFEISSVDTKEGVKEMIAIGLSGNIKDNSSYSTRAYNFFDIKNAVVKVLDVIGLNNNRYKLVYSTNEKFHPNCSADIYIGKRLVGTFGLLHPYFYKEPLFIGELDLSYLLSVANRKTRFEPFSSYPSVRRDISIKVDQTVSFDSIQRSIAKRKDLFVSSVSIFDRFVSADNKECYLGIAIYLKKDDSTLKDEEITHSMEEIIKMLKSSGITLKGE